MTAKQIIRNFQLYLLTDIKLEEPYCSIYNDLENIFNNLNIYELIDDRYLNLIFYGRSKHDLYIEYDGKQTIVSEEKIMPVFGKKYKFSYEDIKGITQWYVNNFLHLKGVVNFMGQNVMHRFDSNTLYLKGISNVRNN